MTANTVTATVNPKKRGSTTALMIFYAVLALFSVTMGILDFLTDRRFFGILFLVAALIFVILLLIKGSTVFGTELKFQDNTLHMKSWDNHFLPYNPDGGIFADLRPAKTRIVSVPAEDITTILIGTKDFVKRNVTESGRKFLKALFPYERASKKSKRNAITALDLFYIETKDACAFMCVHDYTIKNVVAVINEIYKLNPDVSIKVSNREYKRYIMKMQSSEE